MQDTATNIGKQSHKPYYQLFAVTAVYGDTSGMHNVFDYVSYIYLLAIVSLAIINPIGFVLMEYHKQSQNSKMMSGKRVGMSHTESCMYT